MSDGSLLINQAWLCYSDVSFKYPFFYSKVEEKAREHLTPEQAILKAIQAYFCGHASPIILAQLCNP